MNSKQIKLCKDHFDLEWYSREYPDVLISGIDPWEHFMIVGFYLNRYLAPNISRIFLEERGLTTSREVIRPPISFSKPDSGFSSDKELINRSGLFDVSFYLSQIPSLQDDSLDYLEHYLSTGVYDGKCPNKYFIPKEYHEVNYDVKKAKIEPLSHYLRSGAREGRRYRKSIDLESKDSPFFRYMALNGSMIHWDKEKTKPKKGELVSIVIPVLEQIRLTRNCIRSIISNTNLDKVEIILVNNGSSKGISNLIEYFRKRVAEIREVKTPENYNFALGCNLGFQASKGAVVVFLNNDTQVTPGWLEELMRPLSDPSLVATQPKLLFPDGTVQNAGVVFAPKQVFAYPIYAGMPGDSESANIPRKYQALTAACMAVKAEEFAKVRGFDPMFINGQEDIDLCLRITAASGKSCWYQPTSMIYHHESKTPGRSKHITLNRKNFRLRWDQKIDPDDRKYYADDGYRIAKWNRDSQEMIRLGLGISRPVLEKTNVRRVYFRWDIVLEVKVKEGLQVITNKEGIQIDDKLVSVILPTYNRANKLEHALKSVLNQTHSNLELLVIDDGSTDNTEEIVKRFSSIDSRVRYFRTQHIGVSAARNTGLENASGELISFLDSDNTWNLSFLEIMLNYLEVSKADLVYCAISVHHDDDEVLYRGDQFDHEELYKENYIDMNSIVHRRVLGRTVKFDTSLKRLVDWDYLLALTNGIKVSYLPVIGVNYYNGNSEDRISNSEYKSDLVRDLQLKIRERYTDGTQILSQGIGVLYQDVFRSHGFEVDEKKEKPVIQSGRSDKSKQRNIELPKCRISIKIGCPKLEVAQEWGDFHFAVSLKKSLEKLGHHCEVDCIDKWYDSDPDETDVVILLRGLSRYKVNQNHLNIMWNISHPDKISDDEYNEYDHVFVASEKHTKTLKSRLKVPVSVLLQCTDPEIFNPDMAKIFHNDPLFVGNSRNIFRKIVKDCVEMNIPISVYGSRWEQFISKKYLKGTHIPNSELARHYSGAKVVLNDHWDSMREYGFISNRVFDAVACGAIVISDYIEGINELFSDSVICYKSHNDLKKSIEKNIMGTAFASRLNNTKVVKKNHTFKIRSIVINNILTKHSIQ